MPLSLCAACATNIKTTIIISYFLDITPFQQTKLCQNAPWCVGWCKLALVKKKVSVSVCLYVGGGQVGAASSIYEVLATQREQLRGVQWPKCGTNVVQIGPGKKRKCPMPVCLYVGGGQVGAAMNFSFTVQSRVLTCVTSQETNFLSNFTVHNNRKSPS